MDFGLPAETIARINTVFKTFHEVDEVIIYGSRALGNSKPGSDIDLTVKGLDVNLHILNRIAQKLDDLLLPYIFDLSVFNQIENQDLLDHIARVGITFYPESGIQDPTSDNKEPVR